MVLTQSERLRLIEEASNRYVARNKVRDSSELTLIRQAKASSVVAPQIVSGVIDQHTSQLVSPYQFASQNSTIAYFKGVGTQNDYSAILQGAQKCAVCSDDDPSINPYIVLPVPTIDPQQFPFIQRNLSTPVFCSVPGFNVYFPPGPPCRASTNIYYTPSYN